MATWMLEFPQEIHMWSPLSKTFSTSVASTTFKSLGFRSMCSSNSTRFRAIWQQWTDHGIHDDYFGCSRDSSSSTSNVRSKEVEGVYDLLYFSSAFARIIPADYNLCLLKLSFRYSPYSLQLFLTRFRKA